MLNLIIVHLFGLMTPGPDFLYVSRTAASRSRLLSVIGVLGITLGVSFWAAASILGLALLFTRYPVVQGVVMVLGGAYLTYLGSQLLKVRQNTVLDEQSHQSLPQTTVKKEFMRGLLVNLSNVKAVVYFASVMSLVLANLTETWQIWTALLIITFETFFYFYLVSVLFSRKIVKQFYSQYSRYIDNAAGVIFAFFGLYLIYNGILEMSN